jgi:nitroreductase/FMN reductase [NAD(P)H]
VIRNIADLIQERFGLPTEAGRERPANRYGYALPYGWSEDKARQYSVPERHNFGPFIRRHGFGLA